MSLADYVLPAIAFILLDLVWIRLHAFHAFGTWASSLSCASGALPSRLGAAGAAYALLVVALCAFVVRPGQHWSRAFRRGALLGLCIYGVYDLTNKGVLGDCYPWALACVDIAWGTLAVGAAAGLGAAVAQKGS